MGLFSCRGRMIRGCVLPESVPAIASPPIGACPSGRPTKASLPACFAPTARPRPCCRSPGAVPKRLVAAAYVGRSADGERAHAYRVKLDTTVTYSPQAALSLSGDTPTCWFGRVLN